jgi:hypothetical protein
VTEVPLYATLGFTDAEWGLLVGLPQSVIIAASAATHDSARKTRAEVNAGLDLISDARASASQLVTAIAEEIVNEVGDPNMGEEAEPIEPPSPEDYAEDVVGRAAEANALLATKAAPADAETYKHWLVEIAEAVVGAASSGGVLGIGGEVVTEDERKFRDDLARALADCVPRPGPGSVRSALRPDPGPQAPRRPSGSASRTARGLRRCRCGGLRCRGCGGGAGLVLAASSQQRARQDDGHPRLQRHVGPSLRFGDHRVEAPPLLSGCGLFCRAGRRTGKI